MKTDSRLALVLRVIREYKSQLHRPLRLWIDELTTHLYICIDEYIKKHPLANNTQLVTYGLQCCRKRVKKWNSPAVPQTIERKYVPPIDCGTERDKQKLLAIWCESRDKREGMTIISRIISYLHYVEGIPCEELVEIFGKSRQATQQHLYQLVFSGKPTMTLKKNDIVVITCDNPFFHGMLGWVKEPTDYGAEVEVESHCYPDRTKWVLRCVTSELTYIGTMNDRPEKLKIEPSIADSKKVVSNSLATHKGEIVYREVEPVPLALVQPVPPATRPLQLRSKHASRDTIPNGLHDPNVYELDECPVCGKMLLRRNGPCMICDGCGTSTGC